MWPGGGMAVYVEKAGRTGVGSADGAAQAVVEYVCEDGCHTLGRECTSKDDSWPSSKPFSEPNNAGSCQDRGG